MREIVIISGKGGTGKTSLTAAFAALAAKTNNSVLCDADGDAAQCAGVDFIAVGWGYASLDGLRPCQPALTLTHPAELFSLLPPP